MRKLLLIIAILLFSLVSSIADTVDIGDVRESVLGNNAPIFISLPDVPSTLIEGNSYSFNVEAIDPDGDVVSIGWYLDEELVSTTNQYNYLAVSAGVNKLIIFISDGQLNNSAEFDIHIGARAGTGGGGGKNPDADTNRTKYGIIVRDPSKQSSDEVVLEIPQDEISNIIIKDNDISRLLDTVITFQGKEYDVEEFLIVDMDVDSGGEYTREIKYVFAFSETIQTNVTTKANPLEIKFLDKNLKIIEINNNNNNNFTAYNNSVEYFLNSGDSVVSEGKTVKLARVGSGGAIVVDVDGVTETIASSGTETVNGIEITNDETYYDSNNQAASSAELIIGNTINYSDGDNYDDKWEWIVGNLSEKSSTQITENEITGPYFGVVFTDEGKLDDENCINLPNNYLDVCIEEIESDSERDMYAEIKGGDVKTKIKNIETFYSKEIPLGNLLTYENGFEKILDNSNISILNDTTINFKDSNYDVRELLVMGQGSLGSQYFNEVTVETSLTSSEDDYQTDVIFETDRDAIKYYYAFDEAIDLTHISEENPLEIKFLGRDLKIININSIDNSKFKVYVKEGVERLISLDENETMLIDNKNLTIKTINEDNITVDVDGIEGTILLGETKTINGLEITNYDIPDDKQSARIHVKQFYPIYKDGDSYIGQDPDNPDWVWNAGNLDENSMTVPRADQEFSGPYFGIESDFIWNDDSDNPAKVGECIDLPNNYLSICLDSLTVADDNYATYTFEFDNSADLSDAVASLTSVKTLKIHTAQNDGLVIESDKIDNKNISNNIETKYIWLYASNELSQIIEGADNSDLAIFYKDSIDSKIKLAGTINSGQFGFIKYNNTKDTDITLYATVENNRVNLTLVPSNTLIDYSDNITMVWGLNESHFNSLGSTSSLEESSELLWYGAYTGGDLKEQTIGTKDEDHRSRYGIIIKNPKVHGASDEVVLEIPDNQVKANVSIAKNEIIHSPEFKFISPIPRYAIEDKTYNFNVKVEDRENDPVTIKWYENLVLVSEADEYDFTPTDNNLYNFKVVISDGKLENSIEFTVDIIDEEEIIFENFVSSCQDLIYDNTLYRLENDIIDSQEFTCINIQASHIILDLQGHKIDADIASRPEDGDITSNSKGITGIEIHDPDKELKDITIRNGIISEWYKEGIHAKNAEQINLENLNINSSSKAGIYLDKTKRNYIEGCSLSNNGERGIVLTETDFTSIRDCTITNHSIGILSDKSIKNWIKDSIFELNDDGISIEKSSSYNRIINNVIINNKYNGIRLSELDGDNLIEDNHIENNGEVGIKLSSIKNLLVKNNIIKNNKREGIRLLKSDRNTIRNNNVFENGFEGIGWSGISLEESEDNIIYSNIFNNERNAKLLDTEFNNWNISGKLGRDLIGGNLWLNPNKKGFSQKCEDSNDNGICDSTYIINSDNVDNLPLEFDSFLEGEIYNIGANFLKIEGNDININGYEFSSGNTVNMEIEVENYNTYDTNFIIKVILHNLNKNEDLLEFKSEVIHLEAGDKQEEEEFSFEIPEGLDVNDEYAIYLILSEIGDETNNSLQEKVEIDLVEDLPSDFGLCENPDENLLLNTYIPQNKDFFVGEGIKLDEIKMKNNYTSPINVTLEVYLYNVNNKKVELNKNWSFELPINRLLDIEDIIDEPHRAELKIPYDFNEDNDYEFYVKLSEINNENKCQELSRDIDLIRNEHDIRVDKIRFNPEEIRPGDRFDVFVDIINIGKSDEKDLYLEITSSKELEIKEKSEKFNLNKFGSEEGGIMGNKVTKEFSVLMPKNIDLTKDYSLSAIVYFGDGETTDGKREEIKMDTKTNNRAPKITMKSSLPESFLREGQIYILSVEAEDIDKDPITFKWFLKDEVVSPTNRFVYSPDYNSAGKQNIKVIVSDGQLTDEFDFILEIRDVPTVPKAGSFTGTDFSRIPNLKSAKNIVLEKAEKGKIDFKENSIDISNNPDLDSYIVIQDKLMAIDTSKLINFQNKPARVTIKNLNYKETPIIYYNSGFTTNPNEINEVCPESICSNILYENKELSFDVAHFSSFSIGENYEDLDMCSLGKKGNLDVSIKEPDNNDKFNPKETMNIEIKTSNNNDEDKEINVEVVLYDLNDNEEIEMVDDNDNIDSYDSKTFELELKLSENLNENHGYMLYAKVFEEDEEDKQCNEESINIRINRENYGVVIKKAESVNIDNVTKKISIGLENNGKKKIDDVFIGLKSAILNLDLESEKFSLNKYDKKDNKITKEFNIAIPEGVNKGSYPVEAIVYYGNEELSETILINIEERGENAVVTLTPKDENTNGETITIIVNKQDIKKEGFFTEILNSIIGFINDL